MPVPSLQPKVVKALTDKSPHRMVLSKTAKAGSVLLASLWLGCPAQATPATILGQVQLPPNQVDASNASPQDQADLLSTVQAYWQSYLHGDLTRLGSLLAPDVTRMSPRAAKLQQGAARVLSELPKEWEAFERPNGVISEKLSLRHIELEVDTQPAARVASVRYWVELKGGSRWHYDDQGLVLQTFARQNGHWKLTHQSDSWSLSYQLNKQMPGKSTFNFDFVYPVKDLSRALNYYQPLLGQPVTTTATRASFDLKGMHLILDGKRLDGLAQIHPGLPNGYVIFYVDDLQAERKRLLSKGCKFVGGTDRQFRLEGNDPYVIMMDPAGNLFVVMQRIYLSSVGGLLPKVKGFTGQDPYVLAAKNLAEGWLRNDGMAMTPYLGPASSWFDDTRLRIRGIERGAIEILKAMHGVYWMQFDHDVNGMQASMDVTSVRVRPLGKRTLVSYQMTLRGTGHHPYQDKAFVSLIFKENRQLQQLMMVANNSSEAPVLELDYSDYPVTQLKTAEAYYRDVLRLGDPYTDSDYRGFWSNQSVFGIYRAEPGRDGLPRPGQTNAYISFWVHSAQDTYQYLKKQGASFPLIPAINDRRGLDVQPGYTQVYSTDSEGNGVVFTEYTGRRY